jgi:hypothetical protein
MSANHGDRALIQSSLSGLCIAVALAGGTACASAADASMGDEVVSGSFDGLEGEADEGIGSTTQALPNAPPSTGYVWANDLSRPINDPYTAPSSFSFNSAGRSNKITHLGQGRYQVDLPGLSTPGTAQAMGYGGTNRCKLRHAPITVNGGVQLTVHCFTFNGSPADSMFVAFFNNTGDTLGAVAMAAVGSSGTFGQAAHIWSVVRQTTGKYRIVMPHEFGGLGAPLVTAQGSDGSFCNFSSAGLLLVVPPEGPAHIDGTYADVSCYSNAGAPVNTNFQFTHLSKATWPKLFAANAIARSDRDHNASGFYSVDNSYRDVNFDYSASTVLTQFNNLGSGKQSMALASAVTPTAVSCQVGVWTAGGNAFTLGHVCTDVNGTPWAVRVSDAVFAAR